MVAHERGPISPGTPVGGWLGVAYLRDSQGPFIADPEHRSRGITVLVRLVLEPFLLIVRTRHMSRPPPI